MAKTWVVSTHAAAYGTGAAKTISLVKLPPGVRFYFFEDEKVPLSVQKAWNIYNLVMKQHRTAADNIAISQIPGYRMFDKPALPNYTMEGDDSWIDQHGLSASGIFIFGDEFHRHHETFYLKSGQRYSLSEFFAYGTWQPGDQVFWLACRSWL